MKTYTAVQNEYLYLARMHSVDQRWQWNIMLLKVSNKCCSFELSIHPEKNEPQCFEICIVKGAI